MVKRNQRNQHWNRVFSKTANDASLGWYEKTSAQTLKFIDRIDADIPSTIFLAGAGTSMLAGDLLWRGHKLVINEISNTVLNMLQKRLGPNRRANRLLHDLAEPLPENLPPIDIWIDRAVLHFLIEEQEIQQYFVNLQKAIRPGGHVLLAQFSTEALARCAGLDLHLYSLDELGSRIGDQFSLIGNEIYRYTTPAGEPRPYLYALFRKLN